MVQIKAGVTCWSLAFFSGLMLTGCSLQPQETDRDEPLTAPFAVPAADIVLTVPDTGAVERDQMLVVQLSELLDHQAQGSRERAELFYELGVIYDRLGLEASARTMFMNALVESPDYSPAYNFLGIYLASAERFDDAYEAFDAALELNPASVYTNFARALAEYYAGRPKLALQDIDTFYRSNPDDPYRILWYYLIEEKLLPPEEAMLHLKQRYVQARKREQFFGYHVIDYLTGLISREQLVAMVRDPAIPMGLKTERACETYFYLGKQAQQAGYDKLAFDYFHLAAATRKYDFLEYRYALFEIRRMALHQGLAAYKDRNPLREDSGL